MKRLTGWDAFLLYSETANVPMHTLKIAVVELVDMGGRQFGVEEFRQVIHSRLYKLHPLRYELVDIPLKFHHPMWRENCDVDLGYHVRPWRLPAPGGRRELDDAIAEIAGTPLDRTKPLWEMYFVEGLTGGRIAVVNKIHHALADGVAAANLLALGMDLTTEPSDGPQSYETDPAPSRSQLVRTALKDHIRQIGTVPSTIRYTVEGVNRVRRSSRKLSPDLTRPFTPPPSFMNHVLRVPRRFATATVSLDDIKETKNALEISINDLVLAMAAGALRKLSLRYDGHADHPLLASVPVSFDFSARISGNYFTGVLMPIPIHLDTPMARVRETHEAAVLAKESNNLIGPEVVSRWSNFMPPAGMEALFRRLARQGGDNKVLNLNISNVPGPRQHGRVGGALVTEIYSVGPITTNSGLNITVWSYVDQLNISVLADHDSVQDAHEVTDAMVEEFVEIRRAAGLSDQLSVVAEALPN